MAGALLSLVEWVRVDERFFRRAYPLRGDLAICRREEAGVAGPGCRPPLAPRPPRYRHRLPFTLPVYGGNWPANIGRCIVLSAPWPMPIGRVVCWGVRPTPRDHSAPDPAVNSLQVWWPLLGGGH